MDIAKHKQEMAGLLAYSKALKENRDSGGGAIAADGYKLVSFQGKSLNETSFDFKRLRELAEYINRNIDAVESSDDPGFIANFKANRDDFLELAEELPYMLESQKEYLSVLNSIPKGLTWSEGNPFVHALECSEYAEETNAMWRTEPFCNTLLDIKEAAIVEFEIPKGDSACPFSFTDKVWDINHNFEEIFADFGKMDKFDIDNLLAMTKIYFREDWEEDSDINWVVPEGFEDTFIASIVETGYSFKYYDNGPDDFIPHFRIGQMDKIADFLESRSEERLLKR